MEWAQMKESQICSSLSMWLYLHVSAVLRACTVFVAVLNFGVAEFRDSK